MQPSSITKLEQIFEKAPWLKDSKNVVHIPISGMKIEDGLQWKELYELLIIVQEYS